MVILHAFNWKYSEIIRNLDNFEQLGYGAILLPPPLYSDINGTEWWQRYQPKDYRILLSHLGGLPELREMLDKAHAKGIKIYLDIVLNHMANEFRDDKFDFPGKAELKNYADNKDFFEKNKLYGDLSEPLFSYEHFHHYGNINNWGNAGEVMYHNLSDLPDLNESEHVMKCQRDLFKALDDFGFDGFRIDAVKHITEKQIDNTADADFLKDRFMFGEVLAISENDLNIYMRPFLKATHMSAYDFKLFMTIKNAFGVGGSLRWLKNPEHDALALPWDRSVTFVNNHDLPYNDGFRGLMLDRHDELLATGYILGKDGGVPLIFSDNNESAGKFPEDKDRWSSFYKRTEVAGMLKFHNAVHGQKQYPLYDDDNVLVFRRGEKGIVAINKSGSGVNVPFWTYGSVNPGTYRDVVNNYTLKLDKEESFNLFIPPRTVQMWLLES